LIYIISTQLGYRSSVILFLLIIIIKFIITEKEILGKSSKAFILAVLIGLCYFLPHNIYQENTTEEEIVEQVWQEYRPEDIASLIKEDYVIALDVTASWCATCSVNKITTLNNISVLNAMQKFKVIAMRADISKQSDIKISNLMRLKRHPGIPLTIVYSKSHPQGVVLPTILTPHIFISAIKKGSI
jgi:suppressor for copper-sensitivity B